MTRDEARIATRNAAYDANDAAYAIAKDAYAVACDAFDVELARIEREYR